MEQAFVKPDSSRHDLKYEEVETARFSHLP